MSETKKILEHVRTQLAASDDVLKAARERRLAVLSLALQFEGARDTYNSGSIAHGTANNDTDADCGVVLDRRTWTGLGPDGNGVGPRDVVQDLRDQVKKDLVDTYPDLSTRVTKRAIKFTFNEEIEDEVDPSVDLIVALERVDVEGLWIPKMTTSQNEWDASHPQEHTRLLTATGEKSLRVTRARIVRLAKGWNCQYASPALSSFNIEALALNAITGSHDIHDGLLEFFAYAAREVERHLTPDPAGVSPDIKLLLDRGTVLDRLRKARDRMKEALDHDDDEAAAREALARLFKDYVDPPEGSSSASAIAKLARAGNTGLASGAAGVTVAGRPDSRPIKKTPNSFGRGR